MRKQLSGHASISGTMTVTMDYLAILNVIRDSSDYNPRFYIGTCGGDSERRPY